MKGVEKPLCFRIVDVMWPTVPCTLTSHNSAPKISLFSIKLHLSGNFREAMREEAKSVVLGVEPWVFCVLD